MTNRLGDYIRRQRIAAGLRYPDLARRIGYRNLSRGSNKLVNLEREGRGSAEMLEKVIRALDLDRDRVRELIQDDREAVEQEFERRARTPIRPHLVRKVMPAVWIHHALPDELVESGDEEAMVAYGRGKAAEWGHLTGLVLSRTETRWLSPGGGVSGKEVSRSSNALYQPGIFYGKPQGKTFMLKGEDADDDE